MTGTGWIFSILVMLVLIALVVATVVWIGRERGSRRDGGRTAEMSGWEILDRRLASGEIKPAEYEQLRQTLGARPDPAPGSSRVRAADAGG